MILAQNAIQWVFPAPRNPVKIVLGRINAIYPSFRMITEVTQTFNRQLNALRSKPRTQTGMQLADCTRR